MLLMYHRNIEKIHHPPKRSCYHWTMFHLRNKT